ncbi:hypothetical protein [uncultured Desulfobacter sp.]|uniref:hypothetical protein n=2 Tax=uncultured Desulfobacter sp. TaxID=240139 RepID=UPI002AA6E13C|nr:hypothetical protein [uncultured Desulfobacter sp.]
METSNQNTTSSTTNSSTKNSHPSDLSAIINALQKTAFYRQIIPMESAIGWPVPVRKNDRVYILLPLFGVQPTKEKGKTALFAPFATITLDWKTQKLVEYADLRFRTNWSKDTWAKEAGYFPFNKIATLTVGEYREKREKLLKLYDDMFHLLADNRPFSSEFNEDFSSLLRILMEPCLEKYYRVLAPKFFNHFLPELSGE